VTRTNRSRWWATALAVGLTLSFGGCGSGKYPVRGTVTLEDGSPLTRGLVIFERVDGGPPVTARGNVQADGRYELSTERPGDGAPPGRYKVAINPLDTSDVPDEHKALPFDVKYLNLSTSGLECEVQAGVNEYRIKLSRPAGKRGQRR
jgi:hypothetical protein